MTTTRTYIVALVATTLAACTGTPAASSRSSRTAVTVCPGGSTVQGIDVSEFQGSIDWASVKAAGKQFAFIRVSDGTYQDPDFATNWANAKKAGLIRGAYQFFRASDDPITIAISSSRAVGTLGEGDLPPTLDVEVTDGQSAATIRTPTSSSGSRTSSRRPGRIPFIYVSPGFWPSLGSPNESALSAVGRQLGRLLPGPARRRLVDLADVAEGGQRLGLGHLRRRRHRRVQRHLAAAPTPSPAARPTPPAT